MSDTPVAPPLVQTFMTHGMTDAAIAALATGREDETGRVMDAVRRSLNAAPGALQHVVIYGPRGFGKSFMARLVQIETGKLAAERGLPIPFVLLPEEQHNLTRNPHALPAYIAHKLADQRSGEDRSWTGAMFQWPDPEQDARQWDEATAALENELDQSLPDGKGMAIVVIENFDNLLFSVFKDDKAEQRLRKWLDRRHNRMMLIATATGSVDMDYDRPLFQAFQPIRLEPWESDTCIAYFNRRRQAEGKPPMPAGMEAKARAVADFIGGNPRLAQLLADVLETQDALSVSDTMRALADKLADYYRRRIDDLPPLAQGLLDALIRGGEPASQTVLADRVGAQGQSTIARVMQDLQRNDVIRGLPAPDSRETLYRVTDRVFVHFYRLRQGNQMALKTPLASILEFLRAFYSHDERKEQAMNHLAAGRHAEARLFADLAREGGPDASQANNYFLDFANRLRARLRATGVALPIPVDDLLHEIGGHPEEVIGQIEAWSSDDPLVRAFQAVLVAQALARLGLAEQADERLRRQLSANTDAQAGVLLHHERTVLLHWVSRDRPTAIREAFAAGALVSADMPLALQALALRTEAWALGMSERYEETIAKAHEAATLADQAGDIGEQAVALRQAAWPLVKLQRHEEAIATAREAATLADKAGDLGEQAEALVYVAWSLGLLQRHEEAIATAREAATLADKVGDIGEQAKALRQAAWSLSQLQRHEEALATAREASVLADKAGDIGGQAEALWIAAESLNQLARHEAALTVALAGFKLARTAGDGRGIGLTVREALDAALHVPSADAVAAYAHWVEWDRNLLEKQRQLGWKLQLAEALAAATRARAWEDWDRMVDTLPGRVEDVYLDTALVGQAIALRAAGEGQAEGFQAARETLPRLTRLWDVLQAREWLRHHQLASLVSAFARHCRDPGLLRDVASLLTAELTPDAPTQANLLLALARVDAADDPQAVLARLDPDLALSLRRLRDLPEPTEKPRQRKK